MEKSKVKQNLIEELVGIKQMMLSIIEDKEGMDYNPLSQDELKSIKKGDIIERMIGFLVPMYLMVSDVKNDIILAEVFLSNDKSVLIDFMPDPIWEFNVNTGLEIDERFKKPPSYIRRIINQKELDYINEEIKQNPNKDPEVPYPFKG